MARALTADSVSPSDAAVESVTALRVKTAVRARLARAGETNLSRRPRVAGSDPPVVYRVAGAEDGKLFARRHEQPPRRFRSPPRLRAIPSIQLAANIS